MLGNVMTQNQGHLMKGKVMLSYLIKKNQHSLILLTKSQLIK